MKKFFVITAVLFGFSLVLFLIYNFFFANNPLSGKVPNVAVVPNESIDTSAIPDNFGAQPGKSGKISVLVDGETASPMANESGDALVYLVPDERAIKEVSMISGSSRTIVDTPFVPRDIIWSPDASKALVKKSDTEWALLLKEKKEILMLKPGIESPSWTALGDRIVYKYYDPAARNRTLNISNPDGSDWSVIGDIPFQFLEMQPIPQSSSVALWNRGNAFEKTSLRTVSVAGGSPREIFSLFYGTDYLVSPDGSKFLLSRLLDKGGSGISIGTVNRDGGSYKNLSIPTLAGKVVWSRNSRIIYYALPGSVPSGAVLPNDYYRLPIFTADTFWKADTETGETYRVIDPESIDQSYDAESLSLDANETSLFFRNRRDGKIYKLSLSNR